MNAYDSISKHLPNKTSLRTFQKNEWTPQWKEAGVQYATWCNKYQEITSGLSDELNDLFVDWEGDVVILYVKQVDNTLWVIGHHWNEGVLIPLSDTP